MQAHGDKSVPGVMLHAQMVSQLLSAVLDHHRPLIWWWPEWGESFWIWAWAVVGGTLAGLIRRPLYLSAFGMATLAVLYGICYGFFTQAGWIPFIPAAIGLVLALVGVTWGIKHFSLSPKNHHHID